MNDNNKVYLINDVDRVMRDLGYLASDPVKREEVAGYMQEAEEFMLAAGVPKNKITKKTAYTIKSLWADAREKKEPIDLVGKDKMIVFLISQLRRGK